MRPRAYTRDLQTAARLCVYDARYMLGTQAAATARLLWRWLSFALGFVAAGGGVWYGAQQAISEARIAELPLGFGLIDVAFAFERRMAKRRRPNTVALVGDSTLMQAKGMRLPLRQSLPGRIALSLENYAEAGVNVNLQSFIMPGLGPAGLYFASERLIAARPDRVVFALNLRGFTRDTGHMFSYVESAGWMPPGQLREALFLPLWDAGITADRLLFYNGLRAAGLEGAWRAARGLQARAFRLYAPAANGLDGTIGSKAYGDLQGDIGLTRMARNVVEIDGRLHHRRELAERILAPVLSGLSLSHPNLQLLSRVLARLRAEQIPALVYIEPFNIRYLRSLGIPMDGLPRSLRNIRRVVEGQGAELMDLHAILPDAAFRDEGDHYTFEGEPNGTYLVARRLAEHLASDAPAQQAMNTSHALQ